MGFGLPGASDSQLRQPNIPPDRVPVNSARPLDNFPLIRSRRVEELQDAFARVYAKPVVVPIGKGERLDTVFNNCRLQGAYIAFS